MKIDFNKLKSKINLKKLKSKKSIAIIAAVLIIVGIIGAALVWKLKYSVKPAETVAEVEDKSNEKEIEIEPGKPTYTVKAIDGYTAYVIKYSDTDGKPLSIKNEINLIKNGKSVYEDLQQAKQAEVIKDYTEVDGLYYFQLKTDSTFGWKITPSDTKSLEKWTDSKGGIQLSMNSDKSTDGKIVQEVVVLDYKQDVVQPTFYTPAN